MKTFDTWILDIDPDQLSQSELKGLYFQYLGQSKDFNSIETCRVDCTYIRWVKMVGGWQSLQVEISSEYLSDRFDYAWIDTNYCIKSGQFGFAEMSENGVAMKKFTAIT